MNHLRTRHALALVATLSSASLLGCETKLDKGKLEGSITDACKAKGLELKSVDCPAERKAKKDDTFDCKGESKDGDKLVFHVTQTSDKGDIEWKLDGAILDVAKLGDSIESKIGKGADVKCPSKTIVLAKGKSLECKLSFEGKEAQVKLTAEDDDGNVSWKVLD
jgi:hypothetical protein